MRRLFLTLFLLLSATAQSFAFGPSSLMCWQAPTGNTDGTNLFNGPLGYKVYMGNQPGAYTMIFDVGSKPSAGVGCNPDEIGLPFSALGAIPTGQYYAAVTSYNVPGSESAFSNEYSFSFATTTVTTTTAPAIKTTTTTSTVKPTTTSTVKPTTTTTTTTVRPSTTTTTTVRPSIPNASTGLIVR